MPISETKLRELIAGDEGQYFDRKSLFSGPPDQKRPRDRREVRTQIAEQVAGFANADGGVVIFGVEDDRSITGHNFPSDAVDEMLRVPQARLLPPQEAGYRVALDGREILVFDVAASLRAVMVDGNGFPYRIGDTTRQFSEEKINTIKDQGMVQTAEARRTAVDTSKLDQQLLERAMAASGAGDASPSDYLIRRRLADRTGAVIVLREAAVLLFAERPETISHPNASIRVFRVAGTERLTGARHNVQEFPRIEGNLPTALSQARGLLETLIQRSAQLRDLFFEDLPEYPPLAWQEAIVNAVAHRDYAIHGQAVEVWLYDDRLEVLSPGGPPAEVSLDDLRLGRPAHASRNPRIARVLAEIGVMRDQGEGIPRMFEEMAAAFLPVPSLDVVSGRFRVVLRNEPNFASTDPSWARAVRVLPISLTQKRALVGLVDREFTHGDYCVLNGVDDETAHRELQDLTTRGLLTMPGSGAAVRYSVIKNIPAVDHKRSPLELLANKLQETGFITSDDYRNVFGGNRDDAIEMLSMWVASGSLVRADNGRYQMGSQWPPR